MGDGASLAAIQRASRLSFEFVSRATENVLYLGTMTCGESQQKKRSPATYATDGNCSIRKLGPLIRSFVRNNLLGGRTRDRTVVYNCLLSTSANSSYLIVLPVPGPGCELPTVPHSHGNHRWILRHEVTFEAGRGSTSALGTVFSRRSSSRSFVMIQEPPSLEVPFPLCCAPHLVPAWPDQGPAASWILSHHIQTAQGAGWLHLWRARPAQKEKVLFDRPPAEHNADVS